MRKQCPHNVVLPRGVLCDRGYLFLRIAPEGKWMRRGFGPHTSANEKAVRLALEDIRLKQKLGTFNIPVKTKRIKFKDARPIYLQRHFLDYRDPKTNEPRSAASVNSARSALKVLGNYFDDYYLDSITLKLLKLWREHRLTYEGVEGSTINRQMAVLSSLIENYKKWVEGDEEDPIKLPVDKEGKFYNPCAAMSDLAEIPRKLPVHTLPEFLDLLRRLKQACSELKDESMWTVIRSTLDFAGRKQDVKDLGNAKIEGRDLVIERGSKTGKEIRLPMDMKPDVNWAKFFPNFDKRFRAVRDAAGQPWLWYRDLRKVSMQMAELAGFSAAEISDAVDHSSEEFTKKWYLQNDKSEKVRPIIEARRKMMEGL